MIATLRHNRRADYDEAIATAPPQGRWTARTADPNDPQAVALRARTLEAAWRSPIADRVAFLEGRVRGRMVLDIGCVAHDESRMDASNWLHARIAAAASTCLGVDILDAGVDAMRRRGFDAVVHDLTTGLGPIADRGPFDVIVAGELIEHVDDLGMLFRTAAEGLSAEGELILTTPNPYSPRRVRAGQLGIAWENVDHIVYAFPSGIAELAERHGLVLAEAATTDTPASRDSLRRRLARTIKGSHWRTVGIDTNGPARQVAPDAGPLGRALRRLARPRHRFVGETFVYVIRRPAA
ncbi:MAG: class I SAM-dependent methyltransferase [Acidimicrobiales bacterium]|nr:class I SAM-dependent methyltransferase [Acidimicrobiales bacterium]